MNLAIETKAKVMIDYILREHGLNTNLPNMDKIAKSIGWCRTAVRDVFIYLNAKGFVEYTHGKRTKLIKDPYQTEEHY